MLYPEDMVQRSSFQNLEVWKKAMALTKAVYSITADFPAEERFGIVQQLRRAAVSIPSNIAEGHGRRTTRDFANFLGIAMGSVREVQTQLILSEDLGFAPNHADVLKLCDDVAAMLYKLQLSLRS